MKRISQNDAKALEELYLNMSKPIYFYVLRLAGDTSIAEDVMQETFVTLLKKSDLYKDEGRGKAWVFKVAKNLTVDILRKQNRIESLDSVSDSQNEDFTAQTDTRITALRMLSVLNEREKDIVMLRLLSDMTLTEVAKELEIPKGTAFWTYSNAVKKMQKHFKGGADGEK